jgi:CspA family cold shock protein
MERFKGKVIWFNATKGFGFIERQGGPDVFLHKSALRLQQSAMRMLGMTELEDGTEVEFGLIEPDERQAWDVAVLG